MATRTKTKPAAGFDAAVPLAKIHQHPKNPRRNAAASEDLIASVKAQGLMQALVLAPHPDIDGEYVLIAGHRRRDALVQAGATTAKAEIRVDLSTDVQQIEAMLIENSGRADLTAIEEAEAYEQLQLFNLKAADIARAVGQSRQRVASRIKLLTLDPTSRTKVHDGQVTIDDALKLVDLDKATRAELEPLLGTHEFGWKLQTHRDRQHRTQQYTVAVQRATELKIPKYSDDETVDTWDLERDGTLTRLYLRNDQEVAAAQIKHPDCLRYSTIRSNTGVPALAYVCADPNSHVAGADDRTPAEITRDNERDAEMARRRAENEAEAETRRVAAQLRWATLAGADPAAAIRYLLPMFVWSSDGLELDRLLEHLGVTREATDWSADAKFYADLAVALDRATDEHVLRAVVAMFADDLTYRAEEREENPLVARAFDGLHQLGHQFSDVDTEQHRAAAGAENEGGDDE